MLIFDAWAVRLMVHGEFDIPAYTVPELLIWAVKVPRLMIAEESAVRVPTFVIECPLLPPLNVTVLPINCITEVLVEFLIMSF